MLDQLEHLIPLPYGRLLWPALAGSAVFLAGLAVRWILFSRLQKLASRTPWAWDDVAVRAIRGPFVLWCLMAGLYAGVVASPAEAGLERLSGQVLSILWIISATLVVLRLADELVRLYAAKLSTALPLTSLTQNLARGFILTIGGLMILNGLGISITPALTALGVGGLAVALALQDTLTNVFCGMYITMARQVRLGDYIKLDSGEEGYVADISWRSTRVRNLPNNWIVIPNTKMAQAVVTNYSLPSPDLAVLVEVGVDYRSDLNEVERVTCAVAKQVLKETPGAVPDFEPFIRFHTFGDSSVKFTVILRAKSFADQYLVKHEFVKRLHRRYAEEGIAIPFPIRTVIQEPAGSVPSPYR